MTINEQWMNWLIPSYTDEYNQKLKLYPICTLHNKCDINPALDPIRSRSPPKKWDMINRIPPLFIYNSLRD
jgi:hypothetical protein